MSRSRGGRNRIVANFGEEPCRAPVLLPSQGSLPQRPPPQSRGLSRGRRMGARGANWARPPPPRYSGPLPPSHGPPGPSSSRQPQPEPSSISDHCSDQDAPAVDWSAFRISDKEAENPDSLICSNSTNQIYSQLLSIGLLDPKKNEFEKRFEKVLFQFWDSMSQDLSSSDTNPYHSAFSLGLRFPDFREGKLKTNTGRVLLLFEKWIGHQDTVKYDQYLTNSFQKAVFDKYSAQKNSTLLLKAFRSCKLDLRGRDFIPEIKDIIKKKDFKKACDVAHALKLHNCFELEVFVIPMIVENKADSAEEFLLASKTLQQNVIRFLDGLVVDNTRKISDLYKSHPGKTTNLSRLSPKPLGKFIEKWLTKFELDESWAPYHTRTRKNGAFRYLVGQKDEPDKKREHWRDLVYQYVKDDKTFVQDLLNYLTEDRVTSFDLEEAKYWAIRLEVPKDELPYYLEKEMNNNDNNDNSNDNNSSSVAEENWGEDESINTANTFNGDRSWNNGNTSVEIVKSWSTSEVGTTKEETEYFKLPQHLKNTITFVDTTGKFHELLSVIKKESITGLDLEYRPMSSVVSKEAVATLQIATKNQIFIVDFITLYEILTKEEWSKLVNDYFANKGVKKIGFALKGDFKVLAKTMPAVFENLEDKSENVIDLEMMEKKLTGASNCYLEKPFTTVRKGLAGLVETILGLPLDKRDQISDWAKRPLSDDQVTYAALDAYILLELYDSLEMLAAEAGKLKEFEQVAKELVATKNKIIKTRKFMTPAEKAKERKIMKELEKSALELPKDFKPYFDSPIPSTKLKVVCDVMLQGLCKKLRIHGVDAVAIEQFEPFENTGKVAVRDDRMVLTRGAKHVIRLRQMVDKGKCLALISDKPEEQVEEVFRYFNVQMKDSDYFGRCSVCNGSAYITISTSILKDLKKQVVLRSSSESRRYATPEDYEDFEDDFNDDFDDYEEDYDIPRATHVWLKLDGGEINSLTGITKDGVEMKVMDVHDGVIEKQSEFFGCSKCGKIYWHGSHWENVKK